MRRRHTFGAGQSAAGSIPALCTMSDLPMAEKATESDQQRTIGGLTWTDESERNEGRPVWMWHTDDDVDCSNGLEDVADELVGISVAFGELADGKWGVVLTLDHEGSRKNPDLTREEAEQAAVSLATAIRGVWPA